MARWASLLLGVAAGIAFARPAAAAMTLVFRDAKGLHKFHQEGTRVRVANPSGQDDGEAVIADLESNFNVIVYDDAKTYFDMNNAIAQLRPMLNQALKAAPPAAKSRTAPRYRSLHQTRVINGYSCDVYERVAGRRVDAEICFALWGDAIGQAEDYAWFEALGTRLASEWTGKNPPPAPERPRDDAPGLPIWTSSIEKGGTRDVTEIVTISRDPLPPKLFTIPRDYKEIARPMTASERSPARPPTAEDVGLRPAARSAAPRFTGRMAMLLTIVILFGVLVHSVILHIAASAVLDRPTFTQALVAIIIIWGVMVVTGVLSLPVVVGLPFTLLSTYAALKIAYGASFGRTVALFVLCGVIAAFASYAGAVLFR